MQYSHHLLTTDPLAMLSGGPGAGSALEIVGEGEAGPRWRCLVQCVISRGAGWYVILSWGRSGKWIATVVDEETEWGG